MAFFFLSFFLSRASYSFHFSCRWYFRSCSSRGSVHHIRKYLQLLCLQR